MTAVEWLMSQIPFEWSSSRAAFEAFEKAKQMEKEQIMKAHKEGNKYNGWALQHEHEQYYNETFGKI